jgi:hypothetical protein
VSVEDRAPDPSPEPMFTTGPARWRAPVRHHRAGRSRAGQVLGGLGLLAGVVAAGGVVTDSERTVDELHREFVVAGETGEPVAARTIQVTVLAARAASTVADSSRGELDTAGVWVVVRVRVEAVEEPGTLGYAAVRDSRGRTFLASGRVTQPLAGSGYQVQPGIPVEGEVVFEVPADAASGLTVRLAQPLFDRRMEAVAEIPLPVDQLQVEDGQATTGPVPIDPEVVLSDPRVFLGDAAGDR